MTQWHQDFQENFTIQLQGKKVWKFRRGEVQEPIRGITPHYALGDMNTKSNEMKFFTQHQRESDRYEFGYSASTVVAENDERIHEITVEAGDVLFFPSGMWHQVETVGDEVSVSINMSLQASRGVDIVTDAIKQVLSQDKDLREKFAVHNFREYSKGTEYLWNRAITKLNDLKPEDVFPMDQDILEMQDDSVAVNV